MTWNYRVFITPGETADTYGTHETYFDEKRRVINWTQKPISPAYSSMDDMVTALTARLKTACDVVEDGDFFSEKTQLEAWLEACEEEILMNQSELFQSKSGAKRRLKNNLKHTYLPSAQIMAILSYTQADQSLPSTSASCPREVSD